MGVKDVDMSMTEVSTHKELTLNEDRESLQ